ncbi:response regulator [Desertibaculum subflavum]|uniref:response regulator n=1 Tax=Desertibaculum subflavum TaxID=2268458 RepID=UPI000E66D8C2
MRAACPTILVVEDNILNLKLFGDLLHAHGYRTLLSRKGDEGLELARRHRPDLILLDLQLPEISGLEVASLLRADAELARIPVIAVSAFTLMADLDRLLGAGCNAYCQKPISADELLTTVRRLLH